jgi:hypothetical protein
MLGFVTGWYAIPAACACQQFCHVIDCKTL